jgi:AcrR family transcriptional regulator
MAASTQLRGARARAAILAAARRRFSEEGYRRASIEAIAAEASVARPTVYAHFGSKEEIFRTIVGELHDEHLAAMRAAVESSEPVADRLYAALAARFVPFVKITSSSAHGGELLDENSRVCGDITRSARVRSLRLMEEVLNEADAAGEINLADADVTASSAAKMFYDAARGAKEEATVTVASYRRQLKRLVVVLARGLGSRRDA